MGQAYGQLVPANYTAAQLQAAVLSVCTQAWGAPTYRQAASGFLYGYRYIEWPDFAGRKHYWYTTSADIYQPFIASALEMQGTTPNYKNTQSADQTSLNPTDKTKAQYILAVTGADYRVLLRMSANGVVLYTVGRFRGAPTWWGTSDRVYISTDRGNIRTLPGLNPFGVLNSSGNASNAGRTQYFLESRNQVHSLNPITNKRQLRLQDRLTDDLYGTVGYYPKDFGIAAANGISGLVPVLFDVGTGELYISLYTSSTHSWCVKIDASPFSGLTTYPAELYDLGSPPEGVGPPPSGGECEPVRRVTGQIFPDPSALDLQQGTTP